MGAAHLELFAGKQQTLVFSVVSTVLHLKHIPDCANLIYNM